MASGLLMSDQGDVVAMRTPNGKLLGKICGASSANFANCANCRFVPESFYMLSCEHPICEHCAVAAGPYVCPFDNITTEITKPMRVPAVGNTALKNANIECPACGRMFPYWEIRHHVKKIHQKLWKEGNWHTWSYYQGPPPSMSDYDPMPLDHHSQASTSTMSDDNRLPLDPHAQPRHGAQIRASFPVNIALLHSKIKSLEDKNKELQSTIERLRSNAEENRCTTAQYEQLPNSVATFNSDVEMVSIETASECWVVPVFRHIWTLRPYSTLRKRLLLSNATLSTGVLSVNTPGYKIELVIFVTGHTCTLRPPWMIDELCCPASTTKVDFMVRIHHGEDDDLLTWPFANKIALLLVNQVYKDKSIFLELDSGDVEDESVKKPEPGTPNQMFGFPQIISVQDMENPDEGFLFEDKIVFNFTIH